MARRITLLTGEKEAAAFTSFLLERDPALDVAGVQTLSELDQRLDACDGDLRLISFLTDTIVPGRILDRLRLTPYNIHPAPPTYPGAHPESFAIWEGARVYGVTAHEMVRKVDAGAIVAMKLFDMPTEPERVALADLTYAEAIKVFAVVAAHCAETDAPMPTMDARWSAKKRTRKDFRALCNSSVHTPAEKLDLLRRACGPDFIEPVRAAG